MILGTICVIFSFGKGRDYLLRPAGMFFAFAGQLSHIIGITQYVYAHTNNPVFAHILKKMIFQLSQYTWLMKMRMKCLHATV